MPGPEGGDFCGTGPLEWALRLIIVAVLVALFIWKLPAIMTMLGITGRTINDMPQAVENMKEAQNLDWVEIQRITNACDCTKENTTICLGVSGSLPEYTACQERQCPGCFFTGPYLPVVNDTSNASVCQNSTDPYCGCSAGHSLPP
jgi:hypothetical protein